MTPFSLVAASRRWIAAAAVAPAKPPATYPTETLLSDALRLLDQWSSRFGAQVPFGHLPGATMATMDRIGAVIGQRAR